MGAHRQRVGRNLQRVYFLMDRTELDRKVPEKLHGESTQLSKQTRNNDVTAEKNIKQNTSLDVQKQGRGNKGIRMVKLAVTSKSKGTNR